MNVTPETPDRPAIACSKARHPADNDDYQSFLSERRTRICAVRIIGVTVVLAAASCLHRRIHTTTPTSQPRGELFGICTDLHPTGNEWSTN